MGPEERIAEIKLDNKLQGQVRYRRIVRDNIETMAQNMKYSHYNVDPLNGNNYEA